MSHSLTLSEQDRLYIWHPFSRTRGMRDFIPIVRGKGAYLYAEDGKAYLDGTSSWWVNLHGHSHPYIVEHVKAQAEELEHVGFGDFTHPIAINLARRLLSILPGQMSKVFYSDNGSTAVETAFKMALQYWYNQNPHTKRLKIVCFKHSFHGETFGAMSASSRTLFSRPFQHHLFQVEAIDPPHVGQEEHSLAQLQSLLSHENVACFIFEPLILGVGGMITYSPTGLNALLKICHEHGVITIADEVMTGFGRTGSLFACEQLKEQPHILCLSKGLTGGFLPLGATICQEFIFNAFLTDQLSHSLLHGHSYTGNPLACRSALASLDLLESADCHMQRQQIANCHQEFCLKWKGHSRLKRFESLGTILILEYQVQEASYFSSFRDQLYYYFLDRGILLRPFGNVLYVLPPYCISVAELQLIYTLIEQSLEDL